MTIQTITAVFLLSNSTLDEIELNDEVIAESLVSSENGCKSKAKYGGASNIFLGKLGIFSIPSRRN